MSTLIYVLNYKLSQKYILLLKETLKDRLCMISRALVGYLGHRNARELMSKSHFVPGIIFAIADFFLA